MMLRTPVVLVVVAAAAGVDEEWSLVVVDRRVLAVLDKAGSILPHDRGTICRGGRPATIRFRIVLVGDGSLR